MTTMAHFGLRKVGNLFKRSRPKQKDQSHERLFPDVPSPPVADARSKTPKIITKLFRRTLAKPADTVLCTHTVTVTTQAHTTTEVVKAGDQTVQASHDDSDIIEINTTPSQDVELLDIAKASVTTPPTTSDRSTQTTLEQDILNKSENTTPSQDVELLGIAKASITSVTSPPTTGNSSTQTTLKQHVLNEAEASKRDGGLETSIPFKDPISHTTHRDTLRSTHSKEDDRFSTDRAPVTDEVHDNQWINRPQFLSSIEQSTILDPERLTEVQEAGQCFYSIDNDMPSDALSEAPEEDEEEEDLVDPEELWGD
jgi:hypothetical protein